MAEEEEKRVKMRRRMERDAYSVLLSFKDGATARHLERRMDETLGYTYHNKYWEGGVHDMEQLLSEHEQVERLRDGSFKIIPTAETFDLAELVARQKDGHGRERERERRRPGPIRSRRMVGSHSYRMPKGHGGGLRLGTPFAREYPDTGFGSVKPLMSIPIFTKAFNPSTSAFDSTPQRPLSNSLAKIPSPEPSEDLKKPASEQPSIKEYSENSKRMMMKVYPNSVHLSELTDLYAKEFGVVVDPLLLFSKSWKMLVLTTFKSWLEMSPDGDVKLKDSQAPIPKVPPMPKPPQNPPNTPSTPTGTQGFRYQDPKVKNSHMQKMEEHMRELSLSAHGTLSTPEKPPGVTIKHPSPEHFQDLLKPKNLLARAPSPTSPHPMLQAEYDKHWLWNLRMVKKSDAIKENVVAALKVFPELSKNNKRSGVRKNNSFNHNNNNNTRRSISTTNFPSCLRQPPKTEISPSSSTETAPVSRSSSISPPEPTPAPSQNLPRFGGMKFGDRSNRGLKLIQNSPIAPIASGPLKPAVRSTTPELKAQVSAARLPEYLAPLTPQPEMRATTPEIKRTVSSSSHLAEYAAPPTRRLPTLLPPMCKGKSSAPLPRPASSRASSRTRMLQQAVQSDLPDDSFNYDLF